ncbi:hypothetical protein [Clostridium scatologenes]|uniref:NERD domain-containing protein n=1 Tax=Clostridium scatologenes TaxID=1548 RepID=A0A0E3M807_CLOSL|nr:hypothetical protein [Clostridium scatologenes]AKA69328.1 hypothetical protein CSCA_2203 [Clostridium scatologenes]
MNTEESIRNLLKNENKFNPFNDSYNYEEVINQIEYIKSHSKEFNLEEYEIAKSSVVFNSYYIDYYKMAKEAFKIANFNYFNIVEFLTAIVNRDCYLIDKQVNDKFVNARVEMCLESILGYSIKTGQQEFPNVNAQSLLECQIDIMNVILNFLKHFKHVENTNNYKNMEAVVQVIITLFRNTNFYYVVKDTYDSAVWEYGYIQSNKEELSIKYINDEYPVILQCGNYLIDNNILIKKIMIRQKLLSNEKEFKRFYMYKRSNLVIGKLEVDKNRYIDYELYDLKGKIVEDDFYLSSKAQVQRYYPYLERSGLEEISNLSLNDMLILFSQIQKLYKQISLLSLDCNCLSNFIFKIKQNKLVEYLKQTTNFNVNEIIDFLSTLENNMCSQNRIDLWRRPLLKFRDTYNLIISSNVTAANILYLCDEWLLTAGYSLQKRGKLFEKYLKEKLNKEIRKSNFNFKIPSRNKYSLDKNTFEEIDFILILKNVVLVAEVKCIIYPMSPRAHHNSLKILKKASEQVKRKSKFLYENRGKFLNDIGEIDNKKIINAIITNYPTYCGLNINGIPVIDSFTLECYIGSDRLYHHKIENRLDGSFVKETFDTIDYYNNEEEFNANLYSYINKPPFVEDVKKKVVRKKLKITNKNAWPQIYYETAEFKKF